MIIKKWIFSSVGTDEHWEQSVSKAAQQNSPSPDIPKWILKKRENTRWSKNVIHINFSFWHTCIFNIIQKSDCDAWFLKCHRSWHEAYFVLFSTEKFLIWWKDSHWTNVDHAPESFASSAAAAVGGRHWKVGAPCKQVEQKTAHTQQPNIRKSKETVTKNTIPFSLKFQWSIWDEH